MVRITDFMGRVGEYLPGNDRVGEALGRRVGQVFDTTVDTSDTQREAQDEGNRSRERIYSENAGLSSGFTGEFAPQVLGPGVLENFLGMSHAEIMRFVESIAPGEMYESVASWRQLAADTAAAAKAFQAAILGQVTEGWTGLAAESAKRKVTEYVNDTGDLEQAALLVANKVEEAYSGFNQVVAQMPHPPEQPGSITSAVIGALPVVGSSASAAMSMAYEGRAENAQNRAREVMDTVYKPVATQSDTNVPRIPGPAVPGVPEQSGGGTPSVPSSGAGTPSSGTPGSPSDTGDPDQQDTPGDPDTGADPSATDDPDTSTDSSDDGTSTETDDSSADEPTSQSPNSTVPAGTVPTSTTPTTTDPTRTGTPAGPGSPGSPGTPTATPAPGRSIPGTGMPDQAAAAAAARTASTAAGRTGTTGMPGMMSGARGKGDDDREHQAPDYLRRVQEELLPQDQRAVPPVIGGD